MCVCCLGAGRRVSGLGFVALRPGARRREEVSAAPQNVLEVLKVAGLRRFRVPVAAARRAELGFSTSSRAAERFYLLQPILEQDVRPDEESAY